MSNKAKILGVDTVRAVPRSEGNHIVHEGFAYKWRDNAYRCPKRSFKCRAKVVLKRRNSILIQRKHLCGNPTPNLYEMKVMIGEARYRATTTNVPSGQIWDELTAGCV